MPTDFVYETAITILPDENECRVDTTLRGTAAELKRKGFKEVVDGRSLPYRRFLGQADQVRFRLPKGKRAVRGRAATLTARKGQIQGN